MKTEVHKILKDRRIELGLTMLEVAKKVGVSEATISRWESGDIANMRRDRIAGLAKALEINPDVIMGWEELPPLRLTKTEEQVIIKYRENVHMQEAVNTLLGVNIEGEGQE